MTPITPHDPPNASGRIGIESIFEEANRYGTGLKGPRVLYHYTSWEAAEAIVASQQFRATAHDCTNDPAEFASADETIVELVEAVLPKARGPVGRRVLRLFLDNYQTTFRIGASRRAYLVCFSMSRDDPHQWCRYGRRGEGVCLGLRLVGAKNPVIPNVSTTIMLVTYGEAELRQNFQAMLDAFVHTCDRAEDIEHNWRLAIDALNGSAAAWALTTKQTDWASEQEVRFIYLAHEGSRIVPVEEPRPDGTIRRYFPVRVTNRRRMPVQELIIGPNYDLDAGRARALTIFKSARYQYPERKAVASAATLACV